MRNSYLVERGCLFRIKEAGDFFLSWRPSRVTILHCLDGTTNRYTFAGRCKTSKASHMTWQNKQRSLFIFLKCSNIWKTDLYFKAATERNIKIEYSDVSHCLCSYHLRIKCVELYVLYFALIDQLPGINKTGFPTISYFFFRFSIFSAFSLISRFNSASLFLSSLLFYWWTTNLSLSVSLCFLHCWIDKMMWLFIFLHRCC